MGIIGDSITKAAENTATRPIPKSAGARIRFLLKKEKGSTRAVARRLGCSQRTVERYLKGDLKRPRAALAERLRAEVRKDWQPRIRKEAMTKAATSTGIVVETRARFGFTAAVGSTDDPRMRRITELLPPQIAARLLAAHETGANEGELRGIVAEGLQERYFKDNGRRATGLEVEFTDLDYVEMGL
ncbi:MULTISPECIES: telomere-protecting terminal protein Tpg [unclassified Streptomyces]|uniref:telomere-protecting terminal protein Tpg n=1 Tax=unclassified Streptomyces TaxID=2593676 RepID=UPI00365DEAA1